MDVHEAFGADIRLHGLDPDEWGYFVVERRPDVDHEWFVRLLATTLGGGESVVLDSPGGMVVVWAPFGVAQDLRRLPPVAHVGGVTIDPERFRRSFGSDP
jgi:hypothetical protein